MILDQLLTDTDSESALSIAYVHAVAASAGYNCGEPGGPDRDSIDIQIAAGGGMRPKLDIQLKATTRLKKTATNYSFALKKKNYDDLRVETQTPRILVVLDLPAEPDKWLQIADNRLSISRYAYWVSLSGKPDSDNEKTITISIPQENRFDVDSLRILMERSRTGSVGS
jgi:Domain of unknown function (DUF4365)